MRAGRLASGLAVAFSAAAFAHAAPPLSPITIQAKAWRVIPRESGKVNYYSVVDDPVMPYVHAAYKPPYETTVLGFQLADDDRQRAKRLRWTWRAVTLPKGGNECASKKEDSAAV